MQQFHSIITFPHGAHLYGTNTPNSDLDFKTIYLPYRKDLILEKAPKTLQLTLQDNTRKNEANELDHTALSVNEFVRNAIRGDMIAIDLLHAPFDSVPIEQTSSGAARFILRLQKNRHLFYSRNMSGLMGYLGKQVNKYGAKGSRLAFAEQLHEVLLKIKPNNDQKLSWYRDLLPESEFAKKTEAGYELFGSLYQWTGWFSSVLTKTQRMINEYGDRAKLAKDNKGVDFKAVHHAVRAAYQLLDIYQHQNIVFPFTGERLDTLMKVKLGQLDYKTECEPLLESIVAQLPEAAEKSGLPEKIDVDKVHDLVYSIYTDLENEGHWR
jgi:hypothetical protein